MWLALATLQDDEIVNIYTDSMNVIDMLRKWQRKEFLADMRQQKDSDIVMQLLEALNTRTEATHIIKVKSHCWMELNEYADTEAGAVILDETLKPTFAEVLPVNGMHFTWEVEKWDAKEKQLVFDTVRTTKTPVLHKGWAAVASKQAVA